ncbi:hypothetical protein JCM17961_22230 [Endothiovibrio diazotrophicus]
MTPDQLFQALANPTRLRLVMLVVGAGELCVCELTRAIGESQPKVSRHLALLRDGGLLQDRRQGVWVHYRVSEGLPEWAVHLLEASHRELAGQSPFHDDRRLLDVPADRCTP